MGSGRSGIYYTTHGSRMIHHKALIHSLEGEYTTPSKKDVPVRLKKWRAWTGCYRFYGQKRYRI